MSIFLDILCPGNRIPVGDIESDIQEIEVKANTIIGQVTHIQDLESFDRNYLDKEVGEMLIRAREVNELIEKELEFIDKKIFCGQKVSTQRCTAILRSSTDFVTWLCGAVMIYIGDPSTKIAGATLLVISQGISKFSDISAMNARAADLRKRELKIVQSSAEQAEKLCNLLKDLVEKIVPPESTDSMVQRQVSTQSLQDVQLEAHKIHDILMKKDKKKPSLNISHPEGKRPLNAV